jgi:hypothetical protein
MMRVVQASTVDLLEPLNPIMPAHSTLKSRLASLAVGLQAASHREQQRNLSAQQDSSDMNLPIAGTGAFEVSEAMRQRHAEMDKRQQEANDRILKDPTRF